MQWRAHEAMSVLATPVLFPAVKEALEGARSLSPLLDASPVMTHVPASMQVFLFLAALNVGSVFPDWAEPVVNPLTELGLRLLGVRKEAGHRTITHSVWFLLALAGAFLVSLGLLGGRSPVPPVLAGLALGSVIHLLGDAVTVSGIPLFWPLSTRRWRLVPRFVAINMTHIDRPDHRFRQNLYLALWGVMCVGAVALWSVWTAQSPVAMARDFLTLVLRP